MALVEEWKALAADILNTALRIFETANVPVTVKGFADEKVLALTLLARTATIDAPALGRLRVGQALLGGDPLARNVAFSVKAQPTALRIGRGNAGVVDFDLTNVGDEIHELILIKSDMDIAALPPSAIRGEVDEAAIGEYVGGWEDVQPGAMSSGTLMLAPGRYILLCNLTDHYARGMVSTLQAN